MVFSKPYLLADYAEWLIVTKKRSEVSKGDLMMEAQVLEGLSDTEVDNTDTQAQAYTGANTVRREAQIDDCFSHLAYREKAFGKAYPFKVRKEVLSRRPTRGKPSDDVLVYEFLLACGQKEKSKNAPMNFSILCKEALYRMFGGCAAVFNIDAGSTDRKVIGTNTQDMARYLAPILGCKANEDNVGQLNGQGDGGADIVASLDFQDRATGHVAILGQCAATSSEDYWKDKLAQVARFQHLYIWSHIPMRAAFIPVFYRLASGAWANQVNVSESVVFDRLRIVNSLKLDKSPLSRKLRTELTSTVRSTSNAINVR